MARRASVASVMRKQGVTGIVTSSEKRLTSYKSLTPGEGAECIVCWESFNGTCNTPHALWCGHSLCRECVVSLPCPSFNSFPPLTFQLPFCIPCPWCQWLTLRIRWRDSLLYPCKNFSLMWMLDTLHPSPKNPPISPLGGADRIPLPVKGNGRGASAGLLRGGRGFGSADLSAAAAAAANQDARAEGGRRRLEWQQGAMGRPEDDAVIMRVIVNFNGTPDVLAFFWKTALFFARTFLRLVRKLPSIFLLFFLIAFILPISGFFLALYFIMSIFFAIPSSAVAIASLTLSDLLFREIMR
eukprot:TRINITY_DN788_c0_g1_i1.p1 TRINITY_DN788_c0_g1~~TRINITY_DN788_c0_g1_i1.p1  ORF type:complete len:298 (+),score=29.84 TRINITY_DN788_c0_g1_i1:56-949(+)